MKITRSMMANCYELLRTLPPFKSWVLPHSSHIRFSHIKTDKFYGDYLEGERPRIRITSLVKDLPKLILTNMLEANAFLPIRFRDQEIIMKRIVIPMYNPLSPSKAQDLLAKANTSNKIKEIIYKFAADHNLFANNESHPEIYSKVQDWRRGALG